MVSRQNFVRLQSCFQYTVSWFLHESWLLIAWSLENASSERACNLLFRYDGDLTVDTITEFVVDKMGGVTANIRRQYTADVTKANYQFVTEIPEMYKMLLLYERGI